MFTRRCHLRLTRLVADIRHAVCRCLWARPAAGMPAAGAGGDLLRSRSQLLAENALLRQQLLVLRRGVKRLALTSRIGHSWCCSSRQALLLVQPETLLR